MVCKGYPLTLTLKVSVTWAVENTFCDILFDLGGGGGGGGGEGGSYFNKPLAYM